jgi:hypothetical protein
MKKEVQEAINTIKTFLGMEKEVKLAQEVLEDGAVLEADSFEAGQAVSIVNEDERIALPVGEYELPEDRILVVQEEGIIAEIKTKEVEEVEEEAPEMEQVKEEAPMMSEEPAKEIKKTVESIVKETFFSEIEELKKENEELKAKLTELSKVEEVKEEVKEEVVELKEEEPKPIQHNPENKVEREVVKFGKKNDRLSQILNKVYK